MLFAVTMKKLLVEAIDPIKNSKKKPTKKRLLTYINKSSTTNCHKATAEDILCISCTKNLIDENLKLLSENNELIDKEISPTPLPERPSTPTTDMN